MSSTIAVDALRVGMYIHLEGGWLSHPFPLSSFRISSTDQINTLRRLGLSHVRWAPERSDLPDADAASRAAGEAVSLPGQVLTAEALAAQRRREELAAQREAARLCEAQYGEAAQVLKGAMDSVGSQPRVAGHQAAALTQTMLDKMLAGQDVAIRLVNCGGDRHAAHALNVAVIALLIGRSMGLAEEDMLDLGVGALMHDVGKLDVALRFRHLEEGFTTAETNAYRDHVPKGVQQGQRMELSPGALQVLGQHHEHADGSGFPHRLNADRMGLAARIVAIVNRYDNLCNPGSRMQQLTPHEAVATMFAQGRSRFDAAVLNSFIRMMGVYPAGSLVQLTDDRFALVVGVNSSRPLKPRVLVHEPQVPRAEALLLDLETQPDLGIRRSLPASKLPPTALTYLDPRPRVAYYFEPLERAQPPTERVD